MSGRRGPDRNALAGNREYLASMRRVSREKIQVIPNGVDLELFSRSATQWKKRDDAPAVLRHSCRVAGRGTGYPRAASDWHTSGRHADDRAHGQRGRQRNALNGLAGEIGRCQPVMVREPAPQSELVKHLHASDAVLVPLTLEVDPELQCRLAVPLKALEAWLRGLP